MKKTTQSVAPLCSLLIAAVFAGSCSKSLSTENEPPKELTGNATLTVKADSILTVSEVPSGQAEAKRLGQNNPASDFTPTGFYLAPGGTLKVNVQQLSGTRLPRLLVGTYSRDTIRWDPASYQLTSGMNTITDNVGGLIYLRYTTDATPNAQASVKFVSGHKQIPYYVKGKTTHADWLNMLAALTDVPDVMLVSSRAIIVASRTNALKYKDDNQDEVLRIADQVINTEDSISGLDGLNPRDRVNTHRYLMTESNQKSLYMAATWYRTFYHANTLQYLLTVSGLGTDGWGPWHELGHMHQQGAWTWGGLGEVTVNIYSLAAERKRGITPSRLRRDNVWPKVTTFLALSDAERDFNGSKADVWVRLAMFHQLWLAFGDNFYHQLHKRTRQEQPSLSNDAAKMRFFMLTACQVSGKNLSSFFTKWGFKVNQPVYNEIAALNLPAPATDPATLQD